MTSGKRYITTAEAGELIGVQGNTVYMHTRKKPLIDAVSARKGDRGSVLIDTHHPAFDEWRNSNHKRGGDKQAARRQEKSEAVNKFADISDDQISRMQELVTELTDDFGTWDQIFQWSKVRKELAQAAQAELKRDEIQGRLIRRDFVARHVIGLIDGLSRRLLTDISHTLANKIAVAVKRDATQAEIKSIVSDLVGSTIKQVKTEALRNLEEEDPGDE